MEFINFIAKSTKIIYFFKREADQGKYSSIYYSMGFIFILLMVFTLNTPIRVPIAIISILCISISLAFVLFHILKDHKKAYDLTLYYKYLANWSIALFFNSAIFCPYLVGKYTIYVVIPSLYFWIYFGIRYLLVKYLNHWFKYFILYMILPIITGFLWMLLAGTFSDFFPSMKILLNNFYYGIGVMGLCILFLNISVFLAPIKYISEVKVAIYLVLAFFSTISYFSIISDWLTTFLMKYALHSPHPPGINEKDVYNYIRSQIDDAIKWWSVPYLIGTVFGCFSIELRDRNEKKKRKPRKKIKFIRYTN